MARAEHSASSTKTGAQCARKWAYCYIDGHRAPDTASTLLGKAVHKVGEDRYSGRAADWASEAGQIFAAGIHLLPAPTDCSVIEVEHKISLEAGGVRWTGSRDLLLCVGGVWLQVDYKTTSSIDRWALTPEQLAEDLQCCLYSLDFCRRFERDAIHNVWLYLQTKRRRDAEAVNITMSADHALAVVERYAAIARELDQITCSADAPQNPAACLDYGGCPYHVTKGGPCDASPSLRAAYELERKRNMKLDPAIMAKFSAVLTPAAPATPPPVVVPATFDPPLAAPRAPEIVDAPAEPEPPPAEPPPAEPKAPAEGAPPKPRKPRAPKVAPASPPHACVSDLMAGLMLLNAELAEAETQRDKAQTLYEVAQENLTEATGVRNAVLAKIVDLCRGAS